ncbi:MAG: signal peptidase I [Caldisphaera sp.]|jgi:signal peptidase|nr:signal peptidase I [Caldisphaera sp.]PMP60401.1 MAG: signal peptidase I [Caldisphaera sp.]PMP88244.1 MAG: signal peptidase I [Caldisphaera sp.]
MGKKGSKSAGNVLVASVIIIIIALLLIGYFSYGVTAVIVDGISMKPTLHSGDIVFSYKEPYNKIDIGNIVIYRYYDMLIIHRVIGEYYHNGILCFIIKGDNNPVPDPGYPNYCGYYSVDGFTTGGVPYWEIKGVVYTINGNTPLVIPYIGSMTLAIRGTGNDVI